MAEETAAPSGAEIDPGEPRSGESRAPAPRPGAIRRASRAKGGFPWVLVAVLTLFGAVVGFGWAMHAYQESPAQVWERLMAVIQGQPQPIRPAPVVTSAPAASDADSVNAPATPPSKPEVVEEKPKEIPPPASPVVAPPAPDPDAIPLERDPLVWLQANPDWAPKQVVLIKAIALPTQTGGTITVAAGTEVGLVRVVDSDSVIILHAGKEYRLPATATDVERRTRPMMAKADAEATEQLTKGPTAPVVQETDLPLPAMQDPKSDMPVVNAKNDKKGTKAQVVSGPPPFVHPGIGVTKPQLEIMRLGVERGIEPWASWRQGWDWVIGSSIRGPFEEVTRNGDLHRNEWNTDMAMVEGLAYIWYVEQRRNQKLAVEAAKKAITILEAWAATQKVGGGIEWTFMQGDSVGAITGADILRATYPGWTAANTEHTKAYFGDFYWRSFRIGATFGATAAGNGNAWERGAGSHVWAANQGMLTIKAAMASAIYCDDEIRFKEVLDAFLTSPDAGLPNTAPNGQMGDTGRDCGHAGGQYEAIMFTAEAAWYQGVDLFTPYDNRLRAVSEYLAQRQLFGLKQYPTNVPFVPFGCAYGYWCALPEFDGAIRMRDNLYVAREVYKAKGLPMPYCDRLLSHLNYRPQRPMPATWKTNAPTMWTEPRTQSVSMAQKSLGNVTGGVAQCNNGVWTLSARDAKSDPEHGYQFVYRQLTGDATIIAQLTSGSGFLIMTDRLEATAAARQGRIVLTDHIECMWRGGITSYSWPTYRSYYDAAIKTPYWFKLVRRGNFIAQYASPDGVSWTGLVNIVYGVGALPDVMYAGIACSTGTATFAHVTMGCTGVNSIPEAPTAVAARLVADNRVEVKWTPSASRDTLMFYDVVRTDSTGKWEWIATKLTDTTYMDTTAARGTTYTYQVSSAGLSGRKNSAPTSPVTVP
jgi:hypothetical protein